jgi:hypothetical protein
VTVRTGCLLAAAACLGTACRSKPKTEQKTSNPRPTQLSAAAAIDASTVPPAIADSGAGEADAPADAGFSALAGMWHGRMIYHAGVSPLPFGESHSTDNGVRGRAVSAKIDTDGSISLAIQQYMVGPGFTKTGASARCTIEGAIETRGEQLVFVERGSTCKGHYGLASRTGLDLQSPCHLRWSDLGQRKGEGALFTLYRQGCSADRDR